MGRLRIATSFAEPQPVGWQSKAGELAHARPGRPIWHHVDKHGQLSEPPARWVCQDGSGPGSGDGLEGSMTVRITGWSSKFTSQFLTALRPPGRPALRSLTVGYEKAGLVVTNEPIPWNAEAVIVEGVVHPPPRESWSKKDFCLLLGEDTPLQADAVEEGENETRKITFRLLPVQKPLGGDLCWRGHVLGRVQLPFLS